MERPAASAAAPAPDHGEAEPSLLPLGIETPNGDAASVAVTDDEAVAPGNGLWIALLLGFAALLALCLILALVAYNRAPVGAPG